jgi:hypothetical protein
VRTHDELQAAIWNDERGLPPGTREVALALAWVMHAEPGCPSTWTRVRDMLGPDGMRGSRQHWRLSDLIAGDAPRYEKPRGWYGETCEGPRIRPYRSRDGWEDPERDSRVCGASATIHVAEKDMVTGWEATRSFCSRHRDRAAEVKAMLAARGAPPEPIPNTGGLLPRYFSGDWPAIYAMHCERSWTARMIWWKPPYHGVDADDWPVPGKTLIPKRPRLALVATA